MTWNSAVRSEMNLSNLLPVTLTPIKQLLGPSDIPALQASVQSVAPFPITILTYNSVLDKAAGVLGIIHVEDSSTGQEASSEVVQFRRVWPPPRDAFVQIAPNDRIEVEIPLRTHTLEQGKRYDVVAKWAWQGLWKGEPNHAMEACSAGDTTEGLWNGPTTEVQMEGAFEFKEFKEL